MSDTDFFIEKQKAIDEMLSFARKNNADSAEIPPMPSFVSLNGKSDKKGGKKSDEGNKNSGDFSGVSERLGIPLLNGIKKDPDIGLILGLLLVILSENSDGLLLISLLYILL